MTTSELYDQIYTAESVKLRDEMGPVLQDARRTLEERLIRQALDKMRHNGIRRIVFGTHLCSRHFLRTYGQWSGTFELFETVL